MLDFLSLLEVHQASCVKNQDCFENRQTADTAAHGRLANNASLGFARRSDCWANKRSRKSLWSRSIGGVFALSIAKTEPGLVPFAIASSS
jgi:hypothetical protein